MVLSNISNRELKGFMAKYGITYEHLSKELDTSTNTIGNKIRNESFTQTEMKKLISYLKKYDNTVDEHIFFTD